jgi:hypothetical protein
MGSVPETGDKNTERGAEARPTAAGALRFVAFAIGALAAAFWLRAIYVIVARDGVPDSLTAMVSIAPLSIIFAALTIPALELSIRGRWPKMALAFAGASAVANAVWWRYFSESFAGL